MNREQVEEIIEARLAALFRNPAESDSDKPVDLALLGYVDLVAKANIQHAVRDEVLKAVENAFDVYAKVNEFQETFIKQVLREEFREVLARMVKY